MTAYAREKAEKKKWMRYPKIPPMGHANKKGLRSMQALPDSGADERSRTSDLLITNQLLYQLSYISEDVHSNKKVRGSAR